MNEVKEATSLHTMVDGSEFFHAADKKYTVKPLSLKDVDKVMKKLSIRAQVFNLADGNNRKILNEMLEKYVLDGNDKPVSVDRVTEDGWTLVDLRKCVEQLFDISG